jgi:hypothetical protein
MRIPTREELMLEEAIRRRDHSIDELDLNTKTARTLKRNGVDTIGQLVTMAEEELDDLPNLGPRMLAEIVDVVDHHNLMLGLELPDGQKKGGLDVTIGTPVQADSNVRINKHSGRWTTVWIGQDFELRRLLKHGEKFDIQYGGNTYTLIPGDELRIPTEVVRPK